MSEVFDAYARYYDLLYSDKDYRAEAEYVASLVRAHAPNARRILELGCGTGAHAECLARMGFDVHGVDLSDQMVAAANARKAAAPSEVAQRLSFAPGDVRSTRSGGPFDAVISLFHVMSYQTSNQDLEATFETAAAHLAPGGLFVFDFWYGPAVLTQRPEVRVKRLEDATIKVVRIAEPVSHSARNVVDVNFTVFVEEKSSGVVRQIRETHPMRYLFLPEIAQLASRSFDVLDASAWMTSRAPETGDWAGCVTLRRRH